MDGKVNGSNIICLKISKPEEPKAGNSTKPFQQHESLTKEELRKQRKREANRRCAERKRKREQEECEELQRSVAKLRSEVQLLREELARLRKENEELNEENNCIQEEVSKMHGMELSTKFVISADIEKV